MGISGKMGPKERDHWFLNKLTKSTKHKKMDPGMILQDKTVYYYFFSATPQVLAGAIALVGVFYVFIHQDLSIRIKDIPSVLRGLLEKHTNQHDLHPKDKIKFSSIQFDIDHAIRYPIKYNTKKVIEQIDEFFNIQSKKEPPLVNITKDNWQYILHTYGNLRDILERKRFLLTVLSLWSILFNTLVIAFSLVILSMSGNLPDSCLNTSLLIVLILGILGILSVAATILTNIWPYKPERDQFKRSFWEMIVCHFKQLITFPRRLFAKNKNI